MFGFALTFVVLLACGGPSSGDDGRDPCKVNGNAFGLTCSNITSQFFSSVMFFSLDDDIDRFTVEVKRLEIQRSNISVLQMGSFKRMPLLSQLIAANVSLRQIDRGAFEGLTRLKLVDLSHNDLDRVPVDAFRDTRISHLTLEANRHLQIPKNGPILTAGSMKSLVLKNCGLEHLSGSAFVGTRGLVHLDLSENRLEMLPRDVLSPLRLLSSLDLSKNRFRFIEMAVFASIPSYPTYPQQVILAGNPWSCDCRISQLLQWATKNPVDGTSSSFPSGSRLREVTLCYEPSIRRGISWNDDSLRALLSSC